MVMVVRALLVLRVLHEKVWGEMTSFGFLIENLSVVCDTRVIIVIYFNRSLKQGSGGSAKAGMTCVAPECFVRFDSFIF